MGDDRLGFSLIGCCHSTVWELPLFLSMGGQIVDGVPQVDSETGIAWISFYQTLLSEGSAHPDTPSWDSGQMRAAFIGERAGMMNEGEHIYAVLSSLKESLEIYESNTLRRTWAQRVGPFLSEGSVGRPRQCPGRKGFASEAGKFIFCVWRFREMRTRTRIVAT